MSALPRKKIAFFAYETRELVTHPPILNLARVLVNNNYDVDIFIPPEMASKIFIPNINIITTNVQSGANYVKETIDIIRSQNLRYHMFVCFYYEGLVIASELNKLNSTPIAYFAMELVYASLTKDLVKKLVNPIYVLGFITFCIFIKISAVKKQIPPKLVNSIISINENFRCLILYLSSYIRLKRIKPSLITFAIIQDKYRVKVLKKQFSFIDKTYLLPNSYINFNNSKSSFAFKKFTIPTNKKIILFAGGMEKGFDTSLIDLHKNLSDDFVLLFNVYSRDKFDKIIIKKYSKEIREKKIIINSEVLKEDEFDQLVRSSYIGLAWYSKKTKTDINRYYLGLASGKLCKYLSCGIPVIVPNYFHGYKSLIHDKLGYSCNDTINIPMYIGKIVNNYDNFRKKIKIYYKNKLEFSKQAESVVKAIDQLI